MLTPISSFGQNLPCPPPTTVHSCPSRCPPSAARGSLPPSTGHDQLRWRRLSAGRCRQAPWPDRSARGADPGRPRPDPDQPFHGGFAARADIRDRVRLPRWQRSRRPAQGPRVQDGLRATAGERPGHGLATDPLAAGEHPGPARPDPAVMGHGGFMVQTVPTS